MSSVTYDPATSRPGSLHCCFVGSRFDGHHSAPQALGRGAAALLVERWVDLGVPQLVMGPGRVRKAMALAAAALAGWPAARMLSVGVTGTNGKTTVCHLTGRILEHAGMRPVVVGTLSGQHTTPEAPDLHPLLAAKLAQGFDALCLEVSSHALVASRVEGIRMDVAMFTNLSRDHLDFHRSMEAYFQAKAELFTPRQAALGVVNGDDPYGRRLAETASIPMVTYCLSDWPESVPGPDVALLVWRGRRIRLRQAGRHVLENALAAAEATLALGLDEDTIATALEGAGPIRGRMEPVALGQPFTTWVDFAHTPSALRSVLEAARLVAGQGRVVVVFGCGGDRDRGKRPEMGQVAFDLADLVVVTSDNPRSEDPRAIAQDILEGMPSRALGSPKLRIELDRREAIRLALSSARPGDVVVIAGKGHETRQEIGGRSLDFDDAAVAREILKELRQQGGPTPTSTGSGQP